MPRRSRQKPAGPTIPRLGVQGGLFHDSDTFPGLEAFVLCGRDGQRIGTWHAIDGTTDTMLIEALLDFLDRKEPRLSLVRPSPPRRA